LDRKRPLDVTNPLVILEGLSNSSTLCQSFWDLVEQIRSYFSYRVAVQPTIRQE
jgi:hypothetical protein